MKLNHLILRPILISMLCVLFGTGLLFAAEIEDSTLFVEAFNASVKKDYLLAIEKIRQLEQFFPDTPLRDVSLLLLARSAVKSGDNELAGKTINRFSQEFSNSSMKVSIEGELLVLGNRFRNGDKLLPDRQLQLAARKACDERLAQEHSVALEADQGKLGNETVERTRTDSEKTVLERLPQQLIAEDKAARENISLSITVPEVNRSFEVNKRGQLLFELANTGKSGREEFRLSTGAAPEYAVRFNSAEDDAVSVESVESVLLSAGKKYKGVMSFQLPPDRIDGYKAVLPIRIVSNRFSDISFSKDIIVSASAPLIRVLIKPDKTKVSAGESFQYRITLINAGSQAASGLQARVIVPPQLELIGANNSINGEKISETFVYVLEPLLSGGLKELIVRVKVKDVIKGKADVNCLVEINNIQLKHKVFFSSMPVSVSH